MMSTVLIHCILVVDSNNVSIMPIEDANSFHLLHVVVNNNGSLPPGGLLRVTCGLTACTAGSAPGPMIGNEYGKPF